MLDPKSLMSGAPIPAVGASDMKRVWQLTAEADRLASAPTDTVGLDMRVIAAQCSEGADAVAVFVRVMLLQLLLRNGSLDECRDGDNPFDVVFQVLATFPLPDGIQSFRPDEFRDALRKAL
jgi:hypothetical protein